MNEIAAKVHDDHINRIMYAIEKAVQGNFKCEYDMSEHTARKVKEKLMALGYTVGHASGEFTITW